jgi:hypothetical protein
MVVARVRSRLHGPASHRLRSKYAPLCSIRLTLFWSIAMPQFFFHTETDHRSTDTEGIEYPGYVEARREGIRTAGQMMQDAPEVFWGSRPWSVSITDADGLILWEIHLDGQSTPAGRSLEPAPT